MLLTLLHRVHETIWWLSGAGSYRGKDPNRIVTDDKGNKRYIGDDDPILGITGKWMWNPPQWPLAHNVGEDFWDKRRDGTWYHGNGGFDFSSYNLFDADDDRMMRLEGFYPMVDKNRQGEGTIGARRRRNRSLLVADAIVCYQPMDAALHRNRSHLARDF